MADRADSFIAAAADPQLAALAADPRPAVLFDRGGTRILWTNGAGAAYLGVADPAALARRGFPAESAPARRIATLARQLSATEERTERVALPKGLLPQPVVCRARRVVLGIERHVLLVVGDGTGRLDTATAARRYAALTAAAEGPATPAVTELSADIAGVAVPEDAPATPAVPAPAPRQAAADAAGETIPEDVPEDRAEAEAVPEAEGAAAAATAPAASDVAEERPEPAGDATPETTLQEAAAIATSDISVAAAADVAAPTPEAAADASPEARSPAAAMAAEPAGGAAPDLSAATHPADGTPTFAPTAAPDASSDAAIDAPATDVASAGGAGSPTGPATVVEPGGVADDAPASDAAAESDEPAAPTAAQEAGLAPDVGAPAPPSLAEATTVATTGTAAESVDTVETAVAAATGEAVAGTPAEPSFKAPGHGRAVRFVFELDAALAFRFVSDDLAATVGPRAADLAGRPWTDVARDFGLDPLGRVAAALGRRDTFTGLTVDWPVQDAAARVPVDLAGMPVFGRDRAFKGYRGFGIAKCGALFAAPVAVTTTAATVAPGDVPASVDTDESRDEAPAESPGDLPAAEAPALVEEPAVETVDTPVVPQPADAPTDLGAGSDEAAAEGGGEAASPPCEPSDLPAAEAPALVEEAPTVEIVHGPADAPAADVAPDEIADDLGGAAFRDDGDTPDAPPPPAPPTPPAEQPSPPRPEEAPAGPATPSVEPAAPETPPAAPPEAPAPAPSAPDTAPGTPEEAPADLPEEVPAGVPDEAPVERPDEIAPPVVEETGTPLPDEMPSPTTPSEFAAADAGAPTGDVLPLPAPPAEFPAARDGVAASAVAAAEVEAVAPPAVEEISAPADAAAGAQPLRAEPDTRTADAQALEAETVESEVPAVADPEVVGPVDAATEPAGGGSDVPSAIATAETVAAAIETVAAPGAAETEAEPATTAAVADEPDAAADTAEAAAAEVPAVETAEDAAAVLGAPVEIAAAPGAEPATAEAAPVADTDAPAAAGVDATADVVTVAEDAPTATAGAPAEDEPDADAADDAPVIDGVEPDVGWSDRATAEVIPSPIVPRAVPKPFYSDAEVERRQLSRPEREAFQKIAEALGARLEGGGPLAPLAGTPDDVEAPAAAAAPATPPAPAGVDSALLDRLPIAIALLKDGEALFVNRAFLGLTGYDSAAALADAGGISAAFAGSALPRDASLPALRRRDGVEIAVAARLHSVPVDGGAASMLVIQETAAATGASRAASAEARAEELEAILDTATDGVLVLDPKGVVVGANRSAEALFGTERSAMVGEPLVSLLAPESHRAAIDYLDGLSRNGLSSVLNDGREVIGRVRGGGLVPLFMTVGRVSATRFCAVLRDITQWKRAEEELTNAKRAAETASSQKSEFLAKISHEIRTPLNAIIGFSEVMMEERFGPVGSERYKEYLRDIHLSGAHIMSLVNDLLDLSKIEAGKLDLSFEAVAPNDVIRECVALMQPQANRERIIIRTSLSSSLPAVVADSRSLRQIVLNLLSNAIKFNTPGGQVIVSTLYEVTGEVALRVRDTGPGMSEDDIAKALEPFRQLQTTRPGRGTGLGLPLTKALVEANRASFRIDSTVGQGTLVQVTFPSTRVLAE